MQPYFAQGFIWRLSPDKRRRKSIAQTGTPQIFQGSYRAGRDPLSWQGADIEARGEFDWTPLHMAARYGNTGAAK